MPKSDRHEQKFLTALRDIFVGAKIEGDSGYINLMKIKSRYYTGGVFPRLMQDIDAACKPFEPAFREELFDKLHDFFSRYFSESGSIYFRHTAYHHNVYERVYTDDRDVMLFWKTHMLYYVKTDRLFNSMDVELDGRVFRFDVSGLEHKRANEKRELIYALKGYRDGKIVLSVAFSERGRKTNNEDILKELRKKGVAIDDDTLTRACRVFEKQSEVDYFINKNARAFLREQFDLWLYQYVFSGDTEWRETRLRQLGVLRDIAYKIIDFIAQFEDELVRVWNKPKFVLNSHYVITLDKIADDELRRRVFGHAGMTAQIQEWQALGIVDESFDPALIAATDLAGAPVHPEYQYLPLDTRHFPDLELDILALFDDLDEALDGWLVHSENYQALNTLGHKLEGRVECVHIDPPYNTETSGFLYTNEYLHSSWLTMMENRISLSTSIISKEGSILCHIDENEYERLQMLFEQMSVSDSGTIVWDKRNPMNAGRGVATQHEYIIWRSNQNSPIYLNNTSITIMLEMAKEITEKHGHATENAQREFSRWIAGNNKLSGGEKAYRYLDDEGNVYQSVSLRAPEPRSDPKFHIPLIHPSTGRPCPVPPNGFSRTPETLKLMIENGEVIFGQDESTQPRQKVYLTVGTKRQISSVIQDAKKGKADLKPLGLDFPYCHPVSLYTLLVGSATNSDGVIIDFFAGSGTTAHSIIDLNREEHGRRKYILIEMGQHFNTVILPRIKKVVYSDKWKDGQAQPGQGISHFAKYYQLEQYEDTLRRAHYDDSPLLAAHDAYGPYAFLRDLRLLKDTVTLDREADRVSVRLDTLYPGIDLAETLSCVTGKGIRRITRESVEFQDGTTAGLTEPDWDLLKPLLWW